MIIEIVFWHWWILAIALIILELFAPGAFFLWMGISAGIVGTLMLAFPDLVWQIQVLIFSILSILSVILWRIFAKRSQVESDHPLLNKRTAQFIGRIFTLDEPIVDGEGKVKIGDSIWKIRGEDCPAGTKIKVIQSEGVTLLVQPND